MCELECDGCGKERHTGAEAAPDKSWLVLFTSACSIQLFTNISEVQFSKKTIYLSAEYTSVSAEFVR